MGRKRKTSDTGPATTAEKKRKAVKTKRIDREHAGKVVAEYKLLEALIAEQHPELADAKFAIVFRKGWRPDTDGILVGARIKKTSELDKEFDEFDFIIQLNFELWRETKISDEQKTILMDHELCHAAPEMDRDGEQKKDDRGRRLWRLRKHPITEFPEIIKRYGLGKVTGLNAKLLAALEDESKRTEAAAEVNDASRPLLAVAETAEEPTLAAGEWRKTRIDRSGLFTVKQVEALEGAGLRTLGGLQEAMLNEPEWWCKNLKINGRYKQPIEEALTAFIGQQQV